MLRTEIEALWAAKGGTGLPPMGGGSEQTAAEAGAKATAESLIAAAKTTIEANDKTTAEGLDATAKTSILAASKSTAEGLDATVASNAEAEVDAAEAAALSADPTAVNTAAEVASVNANESLREKNAKILSLKSE